MCLEKVTTKEPLTATKNKLVYKSLTKDGRALQQCYQYKLGVITEKVELETRYNTVYKGYHSHASLIKPSFLGEAGVDIFSLDLFIIPKGAKYFEGRYNTFNVKNYVSEQIIWVGKSYNPMSWLRVIKYLIKN